MKKLRLFVANLFVLKIIAVAAGAASAATAHSAASGRNWAREPTVPSDGPKDSRSMVSPRMDFDEWMPLGRGDPLKNDPTFDYLPPALEKVHYWKPPPPSSPPTNQRAYTTAVHSTAAPASAYHYHRRFFLTDYPSNKAEQNAAYYLHKRPATGQVVVAGGFHYSAVPRTPLPMLTPPPYSRPSTSLAPTAPTTARPAAAATVEIGNTLAESRHPPPAAVRAPAALTAVVSGGVQRPLPPSTSSTAAIKVLLEKEIVDRTTVTTTAETPAMPMHHRTGAATTAVSKTSLAVTTDPPSLSSPHTGRPAPVARPMYLIIQGHSKVKTYGLATKPDDVLDRPADVAEHHDHNRLDEDPSRRKRRHSQ